MRDERGLISVKCGTLVEWSITIIVNLAIMAITMMMTTGCVQACGFEFFGGLV
jgi:hypothetical protein